LLLTLPENAAMWLNCSRLLDTRVFDTGAIQHITDGFPFSAQKFALYSLLSQEEAEVPFDPVFLKTIPLYAGLDAD
jgi:hypothetical protein